jgi:pimeloyl-ACP methyl ester carboxylesterase
LLKAARVPGPYLLVGGSAGGLYVQHFAARHPAQVVAVLALNPELPEDEFMARAFPRFTAEEKARERAYASGKSPDNSQRIDYLTSAKQIKADGPVPVPLTIIESQNNTCPSDDKTCNKLVDIGPKINRSRTAAAAPGGRYIPVTASHNLDHDLPEKIVAEIDRLAALSPG